MVSPAKPTEAAEVAPEQEAPTEQTKSSTDSGPAAAALVPTVANGTETLAAAGEEETEGAVTVANGAETPAARGIPRPNDGREIPFLGHKEGPWPVGEGPGGRGVPGG